MKTRKAFYLFLIPAVGIVLLLNVFAARFSFRLDLTEDQRYTLSNATKNILKNLDEAVTVTVYFTEGLPSGIDRMRVEMKEMLIEYGKISDGMVVFKFVNPNESAELEQEAVNSGVPMQMINVREKDQETQKKVAMGAVIQVGEQKEIIPWLPQAAMEYSLSTLIKKLSVKDKPVLGLLQGHGEAQINQLVQAYGLLSIMYEVEPFWLNDTADVMSKYSTVLVIAPKDSVPQSHFNQLDNFLAQGKKMFVALNRVDGSFQTQQATDLNTGFETWLTGKGISMERNLVIDNSCAQVSVQQQMGGMTINSAVQFPYIPVVTKFAEHPITTGLEGVILQFASAINYTGDTTKRFTPLLLSSEISGTINTPLQFEVNKEWQKTDFPNANIPMAGLLEGAIVGSQKSQMVVVSDADFVINQQQGQQVQPDNVNFMVNAIDFLSDDTGLVELRTKGIAFRPLDELEDGTRTMLKYLNFLLPILLIIIYGIFRMQKNKITSIKRMQNDYV